MSANQAPCIDLEPSSAFAYFGTSGSSVKETFKPWVVQVPKLVFLNRIGIDVRSEGIKHPVIRSFDTAGVRGRNGYRLLDFAEGFGGIADIGRGERIEVGFVDDRIHAVILPVAVGEGVFAAESEFDGPVFAELFADGDIRRSDVFVIAESIMIRGSHAAIPRRVGRHVVVGRRERILDSGFDHAGLPELGLEIHFGGVDIDNLLALDINPERIDTTERLVVVRLLEIDGRVIIAVVVDIHRQFALEGFGEGVGMCLCLGSCRRSYVRAQYAGPRP